MKNYILTKHNFRNVHMSGCLVCHSKHFIYNNIEHTYQCPICQSNYAIDTIGIINMLNKENTIDIELHYEQVLLDENDVQTTIHVKKKTKAKN